MFLFIAVLNTVIHLTVWYLGTYIQEYRYLQMHGLKSNCPRRAATVVVKNYLKHIYLVVKRCFEVEPQN